MKKICADANWTDCIEPEVLKAIQTESQGPRHKPIQHSDILDMFQKYADENNMTLSNPIGKLSKDRMRYMFLVDCNCNEIEDYTMTVGFINANDKSKAFTGICGTRVFMCSNGVVTGIVSESKTRHSLNNGDRIQDKINLVYNNFSANRERMVNQIDFLKHTPLTEDILGKTLVSMVRSNVMGATNIARIVSEVDSPTFNSKNDVSCWRLYNAASHVAKNVENPVYNVDVTNRIHSHVLAASGCPSNLLLV